MITIVPRLLGRDLRASALAQAAENDLGSGEGDNTPVTEDHLVGLPEPAQRYLRFMGVVGQPRAWSLLAKFQGRFRRGDEAWMPCEAWQYNSCHPVGRVFHMRIDFARVIPMVGHDTYLGGKGAMHGKVLGLVRVADGEGPEFDEGELVTFLNDALVLAPSMLLDRNLDIGWESVAADAFDVVLTDGDLTVRGRVFVDAAGAMTDFSTTNRFYDGPDGPQRAEWRTPIDGWTVSAGRPLPTHAAAVWQLPEGPLTYIEGAFAPGDVTYNVRP